jgi:hypothetical protein
VTSNHGELFGEDRYSGHAPIMHEKLLEVPFVEGIVPQSDIRPSQAVAPQHDSAG